MNWHEKSQKRTGGERSSELLVDHTEQNEHISHRPLNIHWQEALICLWQSQIQQEKRDRTRVLEIWRFPNSRNRLSRVLIVYSRDTCSLMEFIQDLRHLEHTRHRVLTGSLDNQLGGSNLPPSPLILFAGYFKCQITNLWFCEAWGGFRALIWNVYCANLALHMHTSLLQCIKHHYTQFSTVPE